MECWFKRCSKDETDLCEFETRPETIIKILSIYGEVQSQLETLDETNILKRKMKDLSPENIAPLHQQILIQPTELAKSKTTSN